VQSKLELEQADVDRYAAECDAAHEEELERLAQERPPTLWTRARYWVARFTVAAAAGKPQRLGSHYQLLFLGLVLLSAQYGLFVYLSLPAAYIAGVVGHWTRGATPVPNFIQASSTDVFKYLGVVVAEWLELGVVWLVVRSGVRPRDLIGVAQSRKQLFIEISALG
jgi:hypothetical protein